MYCFLWVVQNESWRKDVGEVSESELNFVWYSMVRMMWSYRFGKFNLSRLFSVANEIQKICTFTSNMNGMKYVINFPFTKCLNLNKKIRRKVFTTKNYNVLSLLHSHIFQLTSFRVLVIYYANEKAIIFAPKYLSSTNFYMSFPNFLEYIKE